jgi:ABC-type transport system substrate-binding protein
VQNISCTEKYWKMMQNSDLNFVRRGKTMRRKMLASLKVVLIIGLLFAAYSNSAALAASGGERKVVIAIPQEPTTLDPSLIVTGPDFVVVENWGEYLLATTQNGDLKPRLATSWRVSSSTAATC